MPIHTLAKLTILGLTSGYLIRLIGTFYHGIFAPFSLAVTIVCLNILTQGLVVLFFVALLKQITHSRNKALHLGCQLAVLGSFVSLVPRLLALARVLEIDSLGLIISYGRSISTIFPWISSLLCLVFCVVFLRDSSVWGNTATKRAFFAGTFGWSILWIFQSLILADYLSSGGFVWVSDLFQYGPVVFLSVSLCSFAGLIYFFGSFARGVARSLPFVDRSNLPY